jgi:cell division protease FtsH
VAERIVFSDLTSGAGDDLKKATQLARRMVCQWGMSEKLGPVTFKLSESHDSFEQRDFSEHTAHLIDEEVQRIVEEMEKKAEEILRPRQDRLEAIVQALVTHETLTNGEIDALLRSVADSKQEEDTPSPRDQILLENKEEKNPLTPLPLPPKN